jgi:hypothetical protein
LDVEKIFILMIFPLFFRYTRILAHYPVPVLVGISFLGLASIICSLTLHDLPDFSDPQAVSIQTRRGLVFPKLLTNVIVPNHGKDHNILD